MRTENETGGMSCLSGKCVPSDGKLTLDIERRKSGGTRLFGTLKRKLFGKRDVSLRVKMKVFKCVVIPVLLCGTTAWVLSRAAYKMRMLRNNVGAGWDDFVI